MLTTPDQYRERSSQAFEGNRDAAIASLVGARGHDPCAGALRERRHPAGQLFVAVLRPQAPAAGFEDAHACTSTASSISARRRPGASSCRGPIPTTPVRSTHRASPAWRQSTTSTGTRPLPSMKSDRVEVSFVMPCLNEELTLPQCIAKARRASIDTACAPRSSWPTTAAPTDRSAIAEELGARVVPVSERATERR